MNRLTQAALAMLPVSLLLAVAAAQGEEVSGIVKWVNRDTRKITITDTHKRQDLVLRVDPGAILELPGGTLPKRWDLDKLRKRKVVITVDNQVVAKVVVQRRIGQKSSKPELKPVVKRAAPANRDGLDPGFSRFRRRRP